MSEARLPESADDRTAAVEMSDVEIAEFLESLGHAVLTLHAESSYSVPVSFGYDADGDRCVLQFVSGPDSEKRAAAADAPRATLVAYEYGGPDDWQSVIVEGELRRVRDDEAARETYVSQAATVGMSVFEMDTTDLTVEWFELVLGAWSGRQHPE